MSALSRLAVTALAAAVFLGGQPASTRAIRGGTASWTLDYTATVNLRLNSTLTKMETRTVLSITTPPAGLSKLTLSVVPRGISAWTEAGATIDGVAAPYTWVRSIGMTFDLSAAPWEPGSVHEVVVPGTITFPTRSDNGLLRRSGSSLASTVITAGDFIPMPVQTAYWRVIADPYSAATARMIDVTLESPIAINNGGVAMSGTQTTLVSGRAWRSVIGPARSWAMAVSPAMRSTSTRLSLLGPDGLPQTVTVTAVGTSSTVRSVDLAQGITSVKGMWAKFGPGPYTSLKIVNAPSGSFAHEFPGLVIVGSIWTGANRAYVTRHEVAHQWWYALVATDQNLDPWMDESLAEWSSNRLVGRTAHYAKERCSLKIDGPNFPAASSYPADYEAVGLYPARMHGVANSYWDCVYWKGNRFMFAVASAMGGVGRLERCLKEYARDNRFASPGPVVLAQKFRDCGARYGRESGVAKVLAVYLSPATVNATN